MRFESSVQRLLLFVLFGFGTIMAAAVYWAVAGPESALNHPTNYRLRDQAASIVRGQIFDRSGMLLVDSVVGENGLVSRHAADPALFSLTGYSSRQYGLSGAEAAYDSILSGATLSEGLSAAFQRDVMHIPQRGSDIQMTVDLTTQQAAAEALASLGQPGGAVVMDARTGALLAVVSTPTIDPATLDTRWADLIQDPARPFINRATQGQYRPGSALGTVILTAWVMDGRGMNDILTVTPGGESSPCNPATGELAVRAAFINGCADALTEMVAQLGKDKFDAAAALFDLPNPVSLEGFTLPVPIPSILPEATLTPDASLAEQLGLTAFQLSPLDMAVMTAVIASGGNAPHPSLLTATRPPDMQTWTPVAASGQSTAVTTAQTAAVVAAAMREASAGGIAFSETCTGTDIGALVGISQTQDTFTLFFTGFAILADGHAVVAAVAVENFDLTRAADLAAAGNAMLCAALAGYAEG